jgi:2-methylcitrate dehydratase PrpD
MEPNASKVAVFPEKDVTSQAERIANFVEGLRFEALGPETRQQLKIRVLDSLGCATGALGSEPTRMIRAYVDDFGSHDRCTLIGGGAADVDRAALYNSALIRYLDFNDSFLAKGETCAASTWTCPSPDSYIFSMFLTRSIPFSQRREFYLFF